MRIRRAVEVLEILSYPQANFYTELRRGEHAGGGNHLHRPPPTGRLLTLRLDSEEEFIGASGFLQVSPSIFSGSWAPDFFQS